jgi:hypothetical protein
MRPEGAKDLHENVGQGTHYQEMNIYLTFAWQDGPWFSVLLSRELAVPDNSSVHSPDITIYALIAFQMKAGQLN